ncbi:MAG: LuxR family transcriptional regulator [Acidimicrobiia bacterium]|nr:MAG: LuxR family transcriptional regulator [Acidimicrobiia bacterium]
MSKGLLISPPIGWGSRVSSQSRSDPAWPFVGREREFRTASAALTARPPRGLLVVGQAGAGKSRFLRELVCWAVDRGWEVEQVRATPRTSSIPLGALSSLLPSETPDALWALYRIAIQALAARARPGRPLLLAVDDAHLLDDTSAALIHQTSDRGIVLPVMTIRSHEPRPQALSDLWTDDLADQLVLGALDRQSSDKLVEAALGPKATSLVKHRVWDLARGNPLLIRELLTLGVELVTDLVAADPTDRLVEVVSQRLEGLDPTGREVLEALAVAGPLEVDLLTPEGRAALPGLERRQLVETRREGRRWVVGFAHPLHGEVLRAGLPPSRLREVSARLAESIEATGMRRRDDLIRVARLQLDSGEPPDPAVLARAAGAAFQVFAYPLAEYLARAASSAGEPEALLVLGEVLSRSGRGEEAEEVYARAVEASSDLQTRVRALVGRAHNLGFVLGRVSDARRLVDEALDEVPPGFESQMLRITGAWLAALAGSFEEAIRLGREQPDAPDGVRLTTAIVSTLGLVMRGQVLAAEAGIEAGLELAHRLRTSMPFAADLLEANRFMGWVLLGRLAEAETLARRHYEETVEEGAPEAIALWANTLGFAEERRGDLPAALRHLTEAAEIARRHDPFSIRGLAVGYAAVAAAQMGDRDTFERLASELDEMWAPEDSRTGVVRSRVQVWRLALEGHSEGASRHAAEAARWAWEHDAVNWGVIIAHDGVRMGHPEVVADLLDEMAREVDGDLVPLMARHARASVAGSGAELAEVADGFLRMGFDLYGMGALAQAVRLLPSREAGKVRGKLTGLRDRYPQAATPLLREAPAFLTPREAQIARLAGRHTSREIAEDLGISVRTVDNHLASVYTKLGISSREELAQVLELG